MRFKYVIGVIQMCSMKVYDPGNLTIYYELTVEAFVTFLNTTGFISANNIN